MFRKILLLGLVFGVFAQDPANCFRRFGNCDIIYSPPYNKIWRVDAPQCLYQCAQDQPKCKAVVYDTTFSICNLYPFTGNSGPGFLIPAFMKVYYQVNDASCFKNVGGVAPVVATQGPEVVPGQPIPGQQAGVFPDSAQSTSVVTVATPPAAISARARFNLASNASITTCANGKAPVYLGLMETNVITPPDQAESTTVSNIGDPSTCIRACSLNQAPNGKSIDCESFTYNSVNQKCTFHSFVPRPDGNAETKNIVGMNTFVKACVSVVPGNSKCKNAMLVTVPHVELVGHVRKSLGNIKSMTACLERCLIDDTCKSFNYYHTTKKCLLHDTDSLASPDSIRAAESSDAIYVENSCGGSSSRRQLAHVDASAVNRFDNEDVKPKPSKNLLLSSSKQSNKSKPKKHRINKILANGTTSGGSKSKSREDETRYTQWGQWTGCLLRSHGQNVRLRLRECKEAELGKCNGKKAEYQRC